MRYLFDTSALIAFFNEEDGASEVQVLLEGVDRGVAEGFVSTISLTELFYLYNAKVGSSEPREIIEKIMGSKLKVLPINIGTSLLAGKFKKGIPLGDALIAANASEVGAKIITDDPHFSKIGVPVLKFR
jgi:predicted nucleic acid-binding protein